MSNGNWFDMSYTPTLPQGFGGSGGGGQNVADIIASLGGAIAVQGEAWYPYMPGYVDYEGQAQLAASQASADLAQAQLMAAQASSAQSAALASALGNVGGTTSIDPLWLVGLGIGGLAILFFSMKGKK